MRTSLSPTRVLIIRVTAASFALSSFLLGSWMMIDPASFWEFLGVGGNPFVQAIYGGAIMGEGVMFALATVWPARYVIFFQYLVFYKTFACLAGLSVLLDMPSRPLGAWLILGGWAFAGVASAAVYPWPSKGEIALQEGFEPTEG
ncbi:MAG: hypothetical protein AAF500_05070 [Myxococcota bacterium]